MVFDAKGFKGQGMVRNLVQTDADVIRELFQLLGRCNSITIKMDNTESDNPQISVLTNSPIMHSSKGTLLGALKECNDTLHVKPTE